MHVAAIGLCLSALLLVYPFVIYPLLLRLLPRATPPDGPAQDTTVPSTTRYALLFCARNEAAALPDTLAALRAVRRTWPDLDIRVFDDASTDATPRILATATDTVHVSRGGAQIGKALGLRRLLAGCDADIVLFMDANSIPDPQGIGAFRRYFADPAIGAVGGMTVHALVDTDADTRYWRREERLKAAETATGSTMGCDGALWGIRRRLLPDFDPAQSDDFRPSMEPLFHGYRVVSAPDIRVMERGGGALRDILRRRVRIACGAWHAHVAMRPRLAALGPADRFKYVSHKLMRWFSGLWLLSGAGFGLVLAVQVGAAPHVAAAGLTLLALAVAGVPPAATLVRVSLIMLATLAGIVIAMAGGKRAQWSPVRA